MSRPADIMDESVTKRRRMEQQLDPHAPPMSRVVHARGVPDGLLSTEMTSILSRFGGIAHIVLMPKLRQALVEFATIEAAAACVNETKDRGILIRDRPVFFNFSKSQEINRGQVSDGTSNRILLMTIQNALYPITCDVIQQICAPIGVVQKIVMVRKRGVQALVEFDSVETATKAKNQLNFHDIYAGCCTLKIEFSRTDSLNVQFNSEDTKDYTGAALPTRAPYMPRGAAGGHNPGGYPDQYGGYGGGPPQGMGMDPYGNRGQPMGYGAQGPGPYGGGGRGPYVGGQQQHPYQTQGPGSSRMPPPGTFQMPGTVIMFYNLAMEVFNCSRLFNLVCLYGNPIKVKFVLSKPGMAMVQVDDPAAAQTALQVLSNMTVFGKTIECSLSKHPFIADSRSAQPLADGTESQMDCTQSMNHRFRSGVYNKSRVCKPTTVLHFFNAPKDTEHAELFEIMKGLGSALPVATLTFLDDGKNTDRGLMEFATVVDASEALVLCNHVEMNTPAGRIYTLKFSFSASSIDPSDEKATRLAPGSVGATRVMPMASIPPEGHGM